MSADMLMSASPFGQPSQLQDRSQAYRCRSALKRTALVALNLARIAGDICVNGCRWRPEWLQLRSPFWLQFDGLQTAVLTTEVRFLLDERKTGVPEERNY
jgi:hypothetical protein